MGSQDKSPNSSSNIQRVKVYRLNEDGKWDDQGTGHVTVDYLERSEDLGLFVVDEDDNETLLLHHISSDDIYRKQEDTIISWRDHELSTELALSFQETAGCTYIWDHICNLQRNMHFNSLANGTFNSISNELTEFPPVELSTLPLILKIVASGSADQSRVTELILQDNVFFNKLMELFRTCEDLENVDGLHLIFKIIRGIILLNSSSILEKVFGDELIMDIIGCLEYDPEASQTHHRNFLKEHVVFKEEIPIKDPLALSKIHQNYRLSYLKDVILPSSLDESTVANLNSIIHSNNAVVVSLLKDDSTFIKELFARLKSPITSASSKKNLVHFLHEFCTLSKSLQIANQHRLFRDLVNEGIFDIISDILQSEDHKLVLTGTDILILFQSLDANILRSYITRPESLVFGLLVRNMLKDFGDDMHCQFLEILRSLLDPMMPGQLKENVVELFYEKHLGQLIDAITSSCLPNCDGAVDHDSASLEEGSTRHGVKTEILLNICDLLCFCVLQHPYRIKCNFLLNNAIDKVLHLTRRKEKYLVLAAIRFVRALISRSDEHVMNHIVKNNLFKPIVDAFVANGDRYNLLNSAVLELFEFIRKENLKVLLRYLVDTFWDQLTKFENLSSIHALKVKYDQLLESAGTRSVCTSLEQRKRLDERAMEKEEEDYFNEDSDEEDSTSARVSNANSQPSILSNGSLPSSSRRSGGLVDYDDDEDDADYKPPPIKLKDASDEDKFLELPLKRKSVSEAEPELKRIQRARKGAVKPRESVFAALCSTLSEAVLPSTKVTSKIPNILPNVNQKPTVEKNLTGTSDQSKTSEPERPTDLKQDVERLTDQVLDVETENRTDREEVLPTSFANPLNDSDNSRDPEKERPLSSASLTDLHENDDNLELGEERPLLPTNSSPEMTVNGS